MPGTALVVGGGISALCSALLLRRRGFSGRIKLVEQNSEVGGLLRSFDYGEFGRFDYGMHTITETGVSEIDQMLVGLLPRDDWSELAGVQRDLSGAFFRGRLQRHCHYLDLRVLPESLYRDCLADFFANCQRPPGAPPRDMQQYARERFGDVIAQVGVLPVVEKFYGHPADRIDPMAARIVPLDRVALFDEPLFRELMSSEFLRARVAYPEQRTLPLHFSSGRRSFYPRAYGMQLVVDALVAALVEADVEIMTGTRPLGLDVVDGAIREVGLRCGDESEVVGEVEWVLWTAGPLALARALGVADGLEMDRPKTTTIVNLLLDRPPDVGDLYYFYCLDAPHRTFRVTNYTAYCPGAPRAGGYPLSVELLLDPGGETDRPFAEALALREIEAFSVRPSGSRVLFSSAQPLPAGFPMVTCRNVAALAELRGRICRLGIRNLVSLGILAEPGVFFQGDVLVDAHAKVSRL